jgi:hypothetical protein
MPEEEAFSLFVTLMNKYGLRDLFVADMAGLHLHLYQFERLLEDFEPALYCHLRRREVKPQLYATQWFLTLFAYRFPLQLVLRIYDLILSEGLESAILKFGLVLMQKNAEALLGMKDMSTLTTFLKERLFDVYIDKAPSANSILENGFFGSTAGVDKEVYRADMLVRDAVSVKVTPEMIKQYTAEWKEQQRIEKDRETELHGLKDKVTSLEHKVRSLEHRAEQSDMEHVQVASELIKTKVENENFAEDNETMKTKVTELQKIVDTQPAEVEARLRSEMDTVMQKNIVVHNENRNLEDSMAEMEKELVAVKMQWATVSSRPPFEHVETPLTKRTDQRRTRSPQTEVEQHLPAHEVSPNRGLRDSIEGVWVDLHLAHKRHHLSETRSILSRRPTSDSFLMCIYIFALSGACSGRASLVLPLSLRHTSHPYLYRWRVSLRRLHFAYGVDLDSLHEYRAGCLGWCQSTGSMRLSL